MLSVWVNNSVMKWTTLTVRASPLSLAVRCGCGLLQSVEILSVCTANQSWACSRDFSLVVTSTTNNFFPVFVFGFNSSLFHYLHSACVSARAVVHFVRLVLLPVYFSFCLFSSWLSFKQSRPAGVHYIKHTSGRSFWSAHSVTQMFDVFKTCIHVLIFQVCV